MYSLNRLIGKLTKTFSALTVMLILISIYVASTREITYSTILLYMEDPVGDDNGPGNYTYPLAPDFTGASGVFDLTRFEVEADDNNMYFKIYFSNIGGNLWNGLSGFSYQYIHIYVKTTLNIKLRNDTFGLNVAVDPGWHFALLLNGGWSTAPALTPVPQGEYPGIWFTEGAPKTIIPGMELKVEPLANTIVLNVSKTNLVDVDNYDKWMFAVFITSYDGYNSSRVRAVTVSPGSWTIGGGDPEALSAGVEPRVMDLLCNSSEEQYRLLRTYNASAKRLAVIPMIELVKTEVTRTITLPEAETTTTPQTTPYTPPTTNPQQSTPTPTRERSSPPPPGEQQPVGPNIEMVVIVISAIVAAFIILAIFVKDVLRRPR